MWMVSDPHPHTHLHTVLSGGICRQHHSDRKQCAGVFWPQGRGDTPSRDQGRPTAEPHLFRLGVAAK